MELQGVGVGGGIAAGPARRMPEPLAPPSDAPLADDATAEVQRVAEALKDVATWLSERGQAAGGDAQAVLEAQSLMAGDRAIVADISERITQGVNAEKAVVEAFASFQGLLVDMGGYMAERAADLADIAQRVIAVLRGVSAPGIPDSDTPFILVAHDLAPADTVLLDVSRVLGIVTRDGGPTSHTAILARAMSLPAVVAAAGAEAITNDSTVVVDAANSLVTVDATAQQVAAAQVRREQWLNATRAPVTSGALKDGLAIPLMANLGSLDEVTSAVELGAEGVGLFRTEMLFLATASPPTLEQQQDTYTQLLAAFPGKKVVVRCLDAGADKPLPFLTVAHEDNPALGQRGLRALRAHENILRDQLTALAGAQAATEAELWVMAPMVADAVETAYFVGLAKELGIRVVGVMAEVPSIALVADQVFEVADFVSVGTNDLTQYTLAADRLLGSLAGYQDPWHPAVLRLIKQLGDAGASAGKPVGVCGEAAADPNLAIVLVGLGATSLSMTPAALADVRAALLTVTFVEAQARATRALTATSAAEARALGSR